MKIKSVKEKNNVLEVILAIEIKEIKQDFTVLFEALKNNSSASFKSDPKVFVEQLQRLKTYGEYHFLYELEYKDYINRITDFTPADFSYAINENDLTIELHFNYSLYPIINLIEVNELAYKSLYNPLFSEVSQQLALHIIKKNKTLQNVKYVENKNHKAQIKDKLIIDYQGYVFEELISSLKQNDYEFILGESNLLAFFDYHLLGVKQGDNLEFNISFPNWYLDKSLANKPVKFKIKVLKVLECQPDVDEQQKINNLTLKNVGNYQEVYQQIQDLWKNEDRRISAFLSNEAKKLMPSNYKINYHRIFENVDITMGSINEDEDEHFYETQSYTQMKGRILENTIEHFYRDFLIVNYLLKYDFKIDEKEIEKELTSICNGDINGLKMIKYGEPIFYMNSRKEYLYRLVQQLLKSKIREEIKTKS